MVYLSRRLLLFVGLGSPLLLALLYFLCYCGDSDKRRRRQVDPTRVQPRKHPSENKEVPIPKNYVGYIIGRGGSRIKKLQEDYGVKIHLRDETPTDEDDTRTLVIVGDQESIAKAEESVKKLIEEKLNAPQPQTLCISIPQSSVGKLIGKQGSNIRQMQRESGAKIEVDNGLATTSERFIKITGQPSEIDYACRLIKELIGHFHNHTVGHAPTSSEWSGPVELEATILPNGPFKAFSSAISDGGSIWIQVITSDLHRLPALVEEMTGFYERGGVPLQDVCQGKVCAAVFDVDHQWYRAVVLEELEGGKWKVLFVDYGDTGVWPASKLRELRYEFCTLKVQAIKCKLADVEPVEGTKWTFDSLKVLDDLTMCAHWKEITVTAVDRESNPPSVSIKNESAQPVYDVATELVSRGLAKWKDKGDSETATPVLQSTLHPRSHDAVTSLSSGTGEKSVEDVTSDKQQFTTKSSTKNVNIEWKGDDKTKQVFIVGDFNNWSKESALPQSDGTYSLNYSLPVGRYHYKFVVDDEWIHNPNLPCCEDGTGMFLNVLNVDQPVTAAIDTSLGSEL